MTTPSTLSPDVAEAALQAANQTQSTGQQRTILPKSIALVLSLLCGGMIWAVIADQHQMVWPLLGGCVAVLHSHNKSSGTVARELPANLKGLLTLIGFGAIALGLVFVGQAIAEFVSVHLVGLFIGLVYTGITYASMRRVFQALFGVVE